MLSILIDNEPIILLAQRAIYWPAQKLLAVADIHFGKAASFRALGVPVPSGTTSQNLLLLDQLIASHDIDHILFLGDFLHARSSHAAATLNAIRAWRDRHPALRLTLVRGNHDDRAGDPPADLGVEVVDEPHVMGPFAFCHHPQESEHGHVMAGHVHPVFRLSGGGDSARLPCFVVGEHCSILPSFGAFTGGYAVGRSPSENLYVVADDKLFALPAMAKRRTAGKT